MTLAFIRYVFTFLIIMHSMDSTTIPNTDQHNLEVRISNLKNTEGKIMATLYRDEKGFPSSPDNAFGAEVLQLKKGTEAKLVFKNVPAGRYALSVFHDENNNNKLDTGTFGIPKEGYGFSNNPKIRFGPPSFKEAAFTVEKDRKQIEIKLNY
jgi:uncharacterized protein (DUF2141 family)